MTTGFRTASVQGLPHDAEILKRALSRIDQPHRPTAGGVEFLPRGAGRRIAVSVLADADTDSTVLFERWSAAFPAAERHVIEPLQAQSLRATSSERIAAGDFTNFWWALEKVGPDGPDGAAERNGKQLGLLRQALLPAFFEAYPGGRVLRITWSWGRGDYLAAVRTLKKLQVVGYDPRALSAMLGRNSMGELGVNVVPELMHHALLLAFAAFWPAVHGFVGTVDHNHVLAFLLPAPHRYEHQEPDPLLQLAPTLFSPLARSSTASPLIVPDALGQPVRRNPFDRAVAYSADELQEYVETFAAGLDETINWITDLTHYPVQNPTSGAIPDADFDFALQAYLTLFMLVGETVMVMGDSRAFRRKMGLFDVVDLHAGLMDNRDATDAFRRLVSRGFSDGPLTAALVRYKGRIGADLQRGLEELREANARVVHDGILFGKERSGEVRVRGVAAPMSFDEFEVRLMRALRNTKHGYAIRDGEIIAMHTGAIHDDMPDYAVALALGLVADRSAYTLAR